MNLTTKMLAVGAVAILAVAGVAAVLMGSNSQSATNEGVPVVTMSEQTALTDQALDLQVSTEKNGEHVPLEGAQVAVCTMEIVREQDRTTLRVMNVTEGYTDANGTAAFGLPQGKYFVYAYSNGQRGFCQGNLTDEEMMMVKSYQWSWGNMEGEVYQYMNQTQGQISAGAAVSYQSGSLAASQDMTKLQTCDCTGDKYMTLSQDHLRDGSCLT